MEAKFLNPSNPSNPEIKKNDNGTVWCSLELFGTTARVRKEFQKYSYQKLSDELEEYGASFPMMTAQELVEWARHYHPNVSIHAYDSTWRKFMKHIASKNNRNVSLVFYIKDHHLYPIQDNHLKHIATQANQGRVQTIYGNIWQTWNGQINRVITSCIKIWLTMRMTRLLPNQKTNQHYRQSRIM